MLLICIFKILNARETYKITDFSIVCTSSINLNKALSSTYLKIAFFSELKPDDKMATRMLLFRHFYLEN